MTQDTRKGAKTQGVQAGGEDKVNIRDTSAYAHCSVCSNTAMAQLSREKVSDVDLGFKQ
jgi:hypothetical protein